MDRIEAKLVLSAMLADEAKTRDDAKEKEAFLTLACVALDDISSIARSLEKLASDVELYRQGHKS